MDNDNRVLLTEVIAQNLNYALEAEQGSEEAKTAFRHAMDAIDRESRMCKDDDSYREVTSKLEAEKEKIRLEGERIKLEQQRIELEEKNRAKEAKAKRRENIINWTIKGAEIVAVGVVLPLVLKKISINSKFDFAKMCMIWEGEGNIPTSMATRSIKDFFRFKD